MGANKTAVLHIRIHPDLKEAVKIAAKREYRSVAHLVETLIIQHCERVGISIPEQQALFEDSIDE